MMRWNAWLGLAMGSILLIGCATPAKPPAKPQASLKPGQVREDACAIRMHDLSQAVLLFYLRNQRLPDSLTELKSASDPTLKWECPQTHQPYIYDRVGFYDMEKHTRVVLFDASPAHFGMRWAVQLVEPTDAKKALITEVVLKPESMFIMRPPK